MLDNPPEEATPPRRVLVCQYRTCRKDGAEPVLWALQQQVIENVTVEACGCLGLCGSGPMVLILPDQVYYWRMNPQKVQKVIESHLLTNQPIAAMMHPRLHPQ